MKAFLTLLLTAAVLFQTAAAHYRFTKLIVNGAVTGEYQYVRRNSNSNSPVGTTSTDIRCNSGAGSGGSTDTATVTAGATVGFAMDQAIFHVGPLLVYMAKAPSTAASFDGSSGWFKIYQIGPTFSGGQMTWPNTDNKSQFTFRIPSSIRSGAYLLRIEHIALHSMPAQHYVACAQINVTGGGSANPSTVSFSDAYSATHPGININIYYPIPTSYQMPGPAVFSG